MSRGGRGGFGRGGGAGGRQQLSALQTELLGIQIFTKHGDDYPEFDLMPKKPASETELQIIKFKNDYEEAIRESPYYYKEKVPPPDVERYSDKYNLELRNGKNKNIKGVRGINTKKRKAKSMNAQDILAAFDKAQEEEDDDDGDDDDDDDEIGSDGEPKKKRKKGDDDHLGDDDDEEAEDDEVFDDNDYANTYFDNGEGDDIDDGDDDEGGGEKDNSGDNCEEFEVGGMFEEPSDYYPPPPEPTLATYNRKPEYIKDHVKKSIELRLVGSHPLWGHHLWNAAIRLADYLDENSGTIIKNKNVLELGAAAGLPSVICLLNGAKKVVATDYPDKELIENLQYNIDRNIDNTIDPSKSDGYIWGKDVSEIKDSIKPDEKYDLIILSDLIFNHSQHIALLDTCKKLLKPTTKSDNTSNNDGGIIAVFFSHHRPWLADRDMNFFKLAEDEEAGFGFKVEKIVEEYMGPMFEADPGDIKVRGTVHGYLMSLLQK
ncbi:Protein N-terminal and lysine N-methyltransferase efm7 [Mycoemilia scoparia]|uniref:Protein N-terminal and lysine N-methyltransferase EFM7 n=1 Tax=Mycoemilia scoparia TaxID=417184 RepID=A0A9W8DQT2_9FUNG|nr:Protein N-terminal and lysine N-methyltransferase efm7 [Mycoemilia scoparia]